MSKQIGFSSRVVVCVAVSAVGLVLGMSGIRLQAHANSEADVRIEGAGADPGIEIKAMQDFGLLDAPAPGEKALNAGYSLAIAATNHPPGTFQPPSFTATVALYSDTLSGATWTQATASAAWSVRYGHTTAVFDDKLWVLGGYTGSFFQNDVWHSSDGVMWTQATARAGWAGRYYHTMAVFDNKLWILGGNTGSNRNDVWWSSDGVTWTQATASAGWAARYGHTTAVFDNKLWVLGGSTGGYKNDVWWSADGATWTQVITAAPMWTARYGHTTEVSDNKLWILGGNVGSYQNDVWWSSDGATWAQVAAASIWPGRNAHTTAVYNNKFWVLGGNIFVGKNDVWYSGAPVDPSAISGYYYVVDKQPDTTPTEADTFSATANISIADVAPGSWWFHVIAKDAIDNVSPPLHYAFTSASTPNQPDPAAWYFNKTISADWTNVFPAAAVRYVYEVDQAPSTVLTPSSGASTTSTTSTTLATDKDGNGNALTSGTWYLHVAAVDAADAIIAQFDLRFNIQMAAPAVSSTTHPDAKPHVNPFTAAVTLPEAIPAGDIQGYRYVIDELPSTDPTAASLLSVTGQVSVTNLSVGSHWFHVRTVDTLGNMTATAHYEFNVCASSSHPDPSLWYFQTTFSLDWDGYLASATPPAIGYVYRIDRETGTALSVLNGTYTTEHVVSTGQAWDGSTLRTGTWYCHAAAVFDDNGTMNIIAGSQFDMRFNVISDAPTLISSSHPNSNTVSLNKDFQGHAALYDGNTAAWTQAIVNAGWSTRSTHTTAVFDNKLWVLGGYDGSYKNDVWWSPDGVTWTQATANAAWSGRNGHTTAVFDNKLWVVGGYVCSYKNDEWSS